MSTASLDRNPCLVIETDENLAAKVSLDLRESGYEPVVAPDVTSGLQARALQPALIVVDRLLAGESGLELCSHLEPQS